MEFSISCTLFFIASASILTLVGPFGPLVAGALGRVVAVVRVAAVVVRVPVLRVVVGLTVEVPEVVVLRFGLAFSLLCVVNLTS